MLRAEENATRPCISHDRRRADCSEIRQMRLSRQQNTTSPSARAGTAEKCTPSDQPQSFPNSLGRSGKVAPATHIFACRLCRLGSNGGLVSSLHTREEKKKAAHYPLSDVESACCNTTGSSNKMQEQSKEREEPAHIRHRRGRTSATQNL